ncbi:FAD-binding protein [soil metagenome]
MTPSAAVAAVAAVDAVRDAVAAGPFVHVAGGATKGALADGATLTTSSLVGVLEYDPLEFTFTALAGTPVREIDALLARHGQYLPFDPPWAEAGATLGGTVASGLSGPGRFRYGGVRDFLLGVRFVNGDGAVVTGGGKVVKNAAGFDFPKLMVGSLGRFGVLVEVTFKVFPRPRAHATLEFTVDGLRAGVEALHALATASLELACLEYDPPGRLLVRVAGSAEGLAGRLERVRAKQGGACTAHHDQDDAALWRSEREFEWLPAGYALAKVALSPTSVLEFDGELARQGLFGPRRYGVGGNVGYVTCADERERRALDGVLRTLGRAGLALTSSWDAPLLGVHRGGAFQERIRSVLDPGGTFALRAGGVVDAA